MSVLNQHNLGPGVLQTFISFCDLKTLSQLACVSKADRMIVIREKRWKTEEEKEFTKQGNSIMQKVAVGTCMTPFFTIIQGFFRPQIPQCNALPEPPPTPDCENSVIWENYHQQSYELFQIYKIQERSAWYKLQHQLAIRVNTTCPSILKHFTEPEFYQYEVENRISLDAYDSASDQLYSKFKVALNHSDEVWNSYRAQRKARHQLEEECYKLKQIQAWDFKDVIGPTLFTTGALVTVTVIANATNEDQLISSKTLKITNIAVGALALAIGMVSSSNGYEISGKALTSSGCALLIQGLVPQEILAKGCGKIKGLMRSGCLKAVSVAKKCFSYMKFW